MLMKPRLRVVDALDGTFLNEILVGRGRISNASRIIPFFDVLHLAIVAFA